MLDYIVAKRQVQSIENFATNVKVKLSAVCENDLMAEYNKAQENRVFTRYSPWAEENMVIDNPPVTAEYTIGRQFYSVHIPADQYSLEDIHKALAHLEFSDVSPQPVDGDPAP